MSHCSKRGRLICSLLLLIGPIAAPARSETRAKSPRPNLIVIMADDLGYGDLSCYGGWIDVPHLERMSREGMRFLDFHSSGNVCSPTRAGLMTGRYQQRAGIPGVVFADPNRPQHLHGLQQSETTFPELLREAGYATAIFGKWHLGYLPKYNPIHHGFDQFRGYVSGNVDFFSHVDQAGNFDWWQQDELKQEEGYTTHLITRHAVEFIRRQRDRPFCLYLPHEAPHYPYQGPHDEAERQVGKVQKTQGKRQDIREAYREMVQEMDRGIGEVLNELREQQLDRNTLVLFFSDNGANQNGSNGRLRGNKGSNWEGGHRVPALAWWPGRIRPGSVSQDLTITLDVMPTLLAVAGVDVPGTLALDGVDLSRILFQDERLVERTLIWNGEAIRTGPWKLIRDRSRKNAPTGFQLFHLGDDLGETQDLADRYPERVARMQAQLDQWRSDVEATATAQPKQ